MRFPRSATAWSVAPESNVCAKMDGCRATNVHPSSARTATTSDPARCWSDGSRAAAPDAADTAPTTDSPAAPSSTGRRMKGAATTATGGESSPADDLARNEHHYSMKPISVPTKLPSEKIARQLKSERTVAPKPFCASTGPATTHTETASIDW